MTVLTDFAAGNILSATETFTITSGSDILPMSGSVSLVPAILLNTIVSTVPSRLRIYSTPRILDYTDVDVQSEKSRPFGGITGSFPESPVFGDLIIDVLSDLPGIQRVNPPLFGGHAGSGSNEYYYYLQDYPPITSSAIVDTSGTVDVNYLKVSIDTGSARVSQSVTVPVGDVGVSGSFITSEIFLILSGSLRYVSGGGSSSDVDYSRLRIYQDESSMDAPGEITRPFESSITSSYQYISGPNIRSFSGSGIVVDILFSGSLSGAMFPVNIGANMYIARTSESWYRYEPGTVPAGSPLDAEFTLQIVSLK